MKLRLVTLVTLFAASTALAQTLPRLAILRVDDPNLDTFTFGAAECNDTLTVGWSNTLTITLYNTCSMNNLKVWATAGECGNAASANDKKFDDIPGLTLSGTRQGTFQVKISELPDFQTTTTADGGTALKPCGSPEGFTKTHRICAAVDYASSTGISCSAVSTMTATPLKLVYDTQPPPVPTITEYAAQDQGVRLGFTISGDATVVLLEAMGPDDADWRQLAETSAVNGSIRGDKLENNVPYDVRLRARDDAGNVSEPTTSISITPIRTFGFWGFYKDAGGTEQGGCSIGSGLMPLLLVAFAFRRSRKQATRRNP